MYLSKLWQKRLSDGLNSTIKSPPVRLYHSSTQISLATPVEYPLESVCTAFYRNQNEVVLLGWNSSHLINCCCHKSNQLCTRSPNMVDDSRSRGCKQCIAEQAGGDGSTLADLWKAENRFPGPVGPPTTFVGGKSWIINYPTRWSWRAPPLLFTFPLIQVPLWLRPQPSSSLQYAQKE